jgi:hypothetical protein
MVINGFSIYGYLCLLMTICGYFISVYCSLLIITILVAIGGYYINDYCWIFR